MMIKHILFVINCIVGGLLGWAVAEWFSYKNKAEVWEKGYKQLEAELQWLKESYPVETVERLKIETLVCERAIPKSTFDLVPRERLLRGIARDFANKIVGFAEIEQVEDFRDNQYIIRMRLQVVDRKRERI